MEFSENSDTMQARGLSQNKIRHLTVRWFGMGEVCPNFPHLTVRCFYPMKYKTEGGNGGRRGHSNMNHRETTAEIKTATRKLRRAQAKTLCREARLETRP